MIVCFVEVLLDAHIQRFEGRDNEYRGSEIYF